MPYEPFVLGVGVVFNLLNFVLILRSDLTAPDRILKIRVLASLGRRGHVLVLFKAQLT